jgi:type II secretory pathway pseudopilin PulG
MPESNTIASKGLTKKQLMMIVGILAVLLVLVLGVVIFSMVQENSEQNDAAMQQQNQNEFMQENNGMSQQQDNSNKLAPGQTNPDIVGFGQTFDCKPRSDQEYYRTDETFVIDPNDPMTMYVSVEYLGFHKSIDGGKTWKLLTNGIKAYGRNEDNNIPCYGEYPFAVIDPTNSNRVILAVSGAGGTTKDVNGLSSGIFESLDGGDSFKQMIDDDMNGYVSSIALDPNDPSVFYYGTNSSPASYLEADPNNIFVETGLVYKLEDGKWTELPTGFNPYTGGTGIHINPANSKELVLFTMSAPKPQGGNRSVEGAAQMGVLRSNDAGKTWSATRPLPANYEAVIVHDVAPNFKNMFVTPFTAGGASPKSFYSLDGGVTFKESSKFMDFIAYDTNDKDGKRLLGYAWQGTQGPAIQKLFESTDSGATWKEFGTLPAEIKNIGDKKTLISHIVWDPVDKNTFYMTGASGYVWKTTDNAKTWSVLLNYEMID